jgi:hypothetical protein
MTKVSRSVTVGDVLQWVSARVRWYRGSRKLLRTRAAIPYNKPRPAISSATELSSHDRLLTRHIMYEALLQNYDKCEEHGKWYLRGFWCLSCRPDKEEEMRYIRHSNLTENVEVQHSYNPMDMTNRMEWVDEGKVICGVDLADIVTRLSKSKFYQRL